MDDFFPNRRDIVNPNPENHNYMLDTSAIEHLDSEQKKLCVRSLSFDYRYFVTDVQIRELLGVPDRTLDYKNPKYNPPSEKINTLNQLFSDLNIKWVDCVVNLHLNFWLLDGSMRILEEDSLESDIFREIHKGKNRYTNDATIAEAAIKNHCVLIRVC